MVKAYMLEILDMCVMVPKVRRTRVREALVSDMDMTWY